MTAPAPRMSAPQTRRALLIAIDVYDFIKDLSGCKNDQALMADILRAQFGFADVRILSDSQATRDAILAAFDTLAEDTQPDDVVVIHYAGHGSQITDREGDEPSGLDSTLMPVDTHGKHGTPEQNLDITDDEIHLKLLALGEKTNNITLIIDACHSGTITRDADEASVGGNVRGEEPDTRPASMMPKSPIPREQWALLKPDQGPGTTRGDAPKKWEPLEEKYVVISGCRDDEKSGEAEQTLPDGSTRMHGALTHFLARELKSATSDTTYRDIFERAAAKVTAFRNGLQHPQMEGKSDRVLFGLREIVPMKYLRVESRGETGNTVTLAAGAALGLTPGSRYAVYPEGTTTAEGIGSLGEIELVDVGAVSSSGTFTEATPGAIQPGARAVLTMYKRGEARLPLRFELGGAASNAPDAHAFREAMAKSVLFRLANDGESAALAVHLLPERTMGAAPVPEAGALSEPTWAVVGADGQLIMPLKPQADWDAVRKNLETYARSRLVLDLENPNPESAMSDQFTVELLRYAADGSWSIATPDGSGGLPVFEDGDFVGVRVTNDKYHSDVYITLMEIGLSGGIFQLYPPGGATSELLVKGGSIDLFTVKATKANPKSGRKVFRIPAAFPFVADRAVDEQLEGIDTLKLFVTSVPASFGFLGQEGMRSEATELELLMQTVMGGQPMREGEDEVTLDDASDWTTVMRPFVLRRKRTVEATGKADPLRLGYATVSAPGISGRFDTTWGSAAALVDAAEGRDALTEALLSSGITVKQSITVSGATSDGDSTRGDGPPALDVQLAAPPDGHGQVLLSRDANGVYAWHFPQAAPSTRSSDSTAAPMQRFLLPAVPDDDTATGARDRGAGATLVNQALKVLVYPLLDPLARAVGTSLARKWEEKHRPYRARTFSPADYQGGDANALDDESWRRMASGRSLLLLHGPFSRAHTGFAGLSADTVAALDKQYEGRVFAFDHFTIGHDPLENAQALMSRIPDGTSLDVDIIAHSRGGLVARMLAERQTDLALGTRKLSVGKVVLIGTPNAGTMLAEPEHLKTLLDGVTTVLCALPGEPATETLHVIIEIVKEMAAGMYRGFTGIGAMAPKGDFLKKYNDGPLHADTQYYALGSDLKPSGSALSSLIRSTVMTKLLSGPNDLFVPSASIAAANGSGMFPISHYRTLAGDESVSHFELVSSSVVQHQFLTWLLP